MQAAKFIDVTRSYIPINPNAFPHGLHGAERESLPEDRIPVSAYKGYNFLPTAYGYKSYFGTTSKLGIDALAARVDHVILYQNEIYENVLIALCDTGIWIKKGEVSGAWVQAHAIAPVSDPNVWFEWTYAIIQNKLYAYRQGSPSYQRIDPSTTVGVTVSSVAPTFLNMAGQVGIFKANGRLGFWDSSDSYSWSSLDDFQDFTPSLETLAGNAKFNELQGRTVAVRSHGPGFMIYATKSILYVQNDPESAYRWQPRIVSSNAGIAYPRQCTIAEPDTLHFAWTPEGLKRIENAQAEVIVPEVTDYLQDYEKPVYLKVLGNRYLFLEILDDEYITGQAQFSTVDVPASQVVFPDSSIDIDVLNPPEDYQSECFNLGLLDNGNLTGPEVPPEDAAPSTLYRPIWAAYLSKGPLLSDTVDWVDGPCNVVGPDGVPFSFTPNPLQVSALSSLSDGIAGKTPTLGSEAFIDGNWTITRFIQTQMALWKAQDDTRNAIINQVLNRARTANSVTFSSSSASIPATRTECDVTRVGLEFTAPLFGYSRCEFWLTRYAKTALDIKRIRADSYAVEDSLAANSNIIFQYYQVAGNNRPTIQEAYAAAGYGALPIVGGTNPARNSVDTPTSGRPIRMFFHVQDRELSPGITIECRAVYLVADGYAYAAPSGAAVTSTGAYPYTEILTVAYPQRYRVTQTMNAYNQGIEASIPLTQDTAVCKVIGYRYTKTDGTEGIINLPSCDAPTEYPDLPGTRPGGRRPSINNLDGSYCSAPFEGAIIDTVSISWPSESVTLPASSFFLQQGSIAPLYPTFVGALVYDLHLKKWGKMKLRYKQLLDYSPLNSTASGNVPTNNFGIMAGALTADGKISLFDQYPTDSYISYGKIGYYRQGYTSMEEAHVQFATLCTGYMKVEVSLEGETLSTGLDKTVAYTNATKAEVTGIYAGKWCNIEIGGIFDIKYLEYRGYVQGKR